MTEYIKCQWTKLRGSISVRGVLALAIVGCLAGVLVVWAVDNDGDGADDAYEDFMGLDSSDPNDAALNYDADTLINLDESYLWTDPFSGDTD